MYEVVFVSTDMHGDIADFGSPPENGMVVEYRNAEYSGFRCDILY